MATIVVGTNSYGTEAGLATYAADRGVTISGTASELLIQAMDDLELRSYKGYKWNREQALSQPRTWYDYDNGDEPGEVPDAFIEAQYINALLIDAGNTLNAPIERAVKREKVDVIEVEYQETAAPQTIFPKVNLLLAKYLRSSSGMSFEVRNGR